MPSPWTDELVDRLKALYAQTSPVLSRGRIADELGMTRNTVIGKVHRLNLHREVRTMPLTRRPSTKPKRTKSPLYWDKKRAAQVYDLPPDESECAVPLMYLESDQCRWVLGEPTYPAMYCGAPQLPGFSYCDRHCRLAYEPARPIPVKIFMPKVQVLRFGTGMHPTEQPSVPTVPGEAA